MAAGRLTCFTASLRGFYVSRPQGLTRKGYFPVRHLTYGLRVVTMARRDGFGSGSEAIRPRRGNINVEGILPVLCMVDPSDPAQLFVWLKTLEPAQLVTWLKGLDRVLLSLETRLDEPVPQDAPRGDAHVRGLPLAPL